MNLSAIAIVTVALLAGCAAQPSSSTDARSPGVKIAEGTVTQLSSGHGNAYTNIRPDQYEPLGLKPGMWLHVAFGHTAMTLVVGEDYADVPTGQPLAVLHREGLTFAIRDGNFSTTYNIPVGATFSLSTAERP